MVPKNEKNLIRRRWLLVKNILGNSSAFRKLPGLLVLLGFKDAVDREFLRVARILDFFGPNAAMELLW